MSGGVLLEAGSRPASGWRAVIGQVERGVGGCVEIAAAALAFGDIAILLSGVVARYIFRAPIVWSDELAGIFFLWLSMLGAAVALRRGEHMRMTAFVSYAKPQTRVFLEMVAQGAALAFLLLIAYPAYKYAGREAIVSTPALEISNAWRAAALPVGVGLMIVLAVLRLVTRADLTTVAKAVSLVAVLCVAMWLASPILVPLGKLNLIVFFVVIVGAGVFAGVPIAFTFALSTFGFMALTTRTPMVVLVGRMDEGMSHMILLAVPLFVFLGLLIEMTGMARAMVRFLANLLGHVRGGLSYVLIGAIYLVSGISGSKAADMAAIAPVLFPEMKARGADQGDLVALLATTGAQTETVPPSIVLITIGSVTGVSIAALFTGGMLPGLLLGLALCLVVWWRYRKEDLSGIVRASRKEIWWSFLYSLPALALPIIVRTAVVEGVATATEVSTIGIAYATIVGIFVYRCFDAKRLIPMLIETAALSGAIVFIIGAATGMAWALTQSGFASNLATFIASLPGGQVTFMAVSILVFVILGSLLEGIPAIVLFGPLMFPIAHQVGVHEVHYAIVVVLSMGLGLFAPPFGVGYYTACAIGKVDPSLGMRPIWGYMTALAIGIVVIAAWPWLSIGFL
ncbi:TRAP transporter large permease subunit [Neorhizobium alkalisoli]|uniref:Tripartite ATP-independent transporter DctM subunit n=1 Tax=Neorhizobium alkalisoli TaxID=528178 RepID=A0A561QAR7_9HYPH|nr:TRAP transporter large permease subunit [Neorhizobium alkalisoli]TWF47459.1 tripartite ATP-independent transporter DctM subunit [Neorhizobium alkalisoli]